MKDSNFLKENNARHMWAPMGHPRQIMESPGTIISAADGVSLTDIDGHRVVDAVGGLWNTNLGYSCEPIKKAISDQLQKMPYYSIFPGSTNEPVIELSYKLREFFEPEGFVRAFFTSGGSDSVETCLRLARQYHKVRREHQRTKFLSLKKGYHGTHFGAASVNGNNRFRTMYEPLLPGCFHMVSPYTYRNPFNETDPSKLADLCIAATLDEIAFQGGNTIAAFIMEPILGAGGIIVPHESFMPRMREICDAHGILMIADEVITCFGRTGDWTGSRHWGVKPDMMATAKAITSGYFPLGAAMLNEKVVDVFESDTSGDAGIGHGYTYSGHPVGAAAALACLEETERLNVTENAAARGTEMFEGAKSLMAKHEIIGDIRGGHGLMTALELVSDRATKAPDMKAGPVVLKGAYENGAMIRVSGNNILLSPPLILTSANVQTILSAIDAGLTAARA
ncbi:MAG: aminotransferase class III-fold pyridoxal phosphate-dependent enzyme [Rhodobacterales bacterium]